MKRVKQIEVVLSDEPVSYCRQHEKVKEIKLCFSDEKLVKISYPVEIWIRRFGSSAIEELEKILSECPLCKELEREEIEHE